MKVKVKPSVVSKKAKGSGTDSDPAPVITLKFATISSVFGNATSIPAAVVVAGGLPSFNPGAAIATISFDYNSKPTKKTPLSFAVTVIDGASGASFTAAGKLIATHIGRGGRFLTGKGVGFVTSAAGDVFGQIPQGAAVRIRLGNDGTSAWISLYNAP
jgi:hypothetical protein